MSESKIIKNDFTRLNDFAKHMEQYEKKYIVRIGILGKNVNRHDGRRSSSNAYIGSVHEFGKGRVPERSFLRATISRKQDEIIENAKALAWKSMFAGGIKTMFNTLGVLCVRYVLEAFESGGMGSWAPLKASTIRRKIGRNPQPLVNSAQLRNAISYDVKTKK